MIINLLAETIECLEMHNKTLDDVEWVGCSTFQIPKDNFLKIANVNYSNGYGTAEVARDLVIVGKDFYLERGEYDGSEWWEYKSIPEMPDRVKEIGSLITKWDYLSEQYD